ncbi:hypothetical protein [Paraburkholderia sediminicola]|uniref:hypothetical protein n=1 Tax=Paraburkholderia sediminicola TaxID=458836 RepID=UPI0038B8B2B2
MIHHLSIAAKNPEHAAKVLAKLIGGWAGPFPVSPGAYMVMQLDDYGTSVEIYPSGTELHPVEKEEGWGIIPCEPRNPAYGPTHFAISVKRSPEEIAEIMAEEDWLCRRHDRAFFPVLEVWIENTTMFELLPPEFAAKYLAVTSEGNRQAIAGNNPFGPPPHAHG